MYQFVADNITDNVDKDAFRDRVKRKLSEILPLVNSEQGRNALKSYVQEVEKISQHDLGLKLLSLFKEYELDDFTILRTISNLVEQVKAQDILTDKNLMILVLGNYEMLEKIAPVLGIAVENVKPAFFTKILQYMGLVRRYENAEMHFQSLVKTIRQWQKPFNSLKIIRQQYYNSEYHLPKGFYQEIPGLNIYHKYKSYLSLHK